MHKGKLKRIIENNCVKIIKIKKFSSRIYLHFDKGFFTSSTYHSEEGKEKNDA